MSPLLQDERIEKFQNIVGLDERIGVSELARSKAWRDQLPEVGCFEVVDRGDTIGYMLAPEYASALSERMAQLEAELEAANVARLFELRLGCSDPATGSKLREEAEAYLDENLGAVREFLDGDN